MIADPISIPAGVEHTSPRVDAKSKAFLGEVGRRWRWGRRIFVGAFVVTAMIAPFLAWTAGVLSAWSLTGFHLFSPPIESGPDKLILVGTTYVSFFVLPFLILLPFCAPLAIRWKNPPRIVVFRRFNERRLNAALKRTLRSRVVRYGHVFTLADELFYVPLLIRIPVLTGQLGLFQFRQRRIRSTRALERLRDDLRDRTVLNMNWLMSWRKVFAIECVDELWRSAVSTLLEDADLVLIDVSRRREALLWELEECARLNLLDRVVVIAHAPAPDPQIFDWLDSVLPVARGTVPRFTYFDDGGIRQTEMFEKTVAQVLASRTCRASARSLRGLRRQILGNLAAIGLGTALGFLLLLPYVAPSLAGRFSPLTSQVREAYVVKADETAKHRLETEFREETKRWVLANANQGGTKLNTLLAAVADARDASTLESLVAADSPLASGALQALIRIAPRELGIAAARWILSSNRSVRSSGLNVLAERPSDLLFDSLLADLPQAAWFAGDRDVDAFLEQRLHRGHMEALVAGLSAPNLSFRVLAARVLAGFDDPRSVPGLIACLTFRYPGFLFFPGPGVQGCKELLDGFLARSTPVRVSDVADLLPAGDERAAYALRFALHAQEPAAFDAALAKVAVSQSLLEAFLAAEQSHHPADTDVRSRVLANRRWFAPALVDEKLAYRLVAARVLAQAGDVEVAPVLVELSEVRESSPAWRANGVNSWKLASERDPYLEASLAALAELAERVRPPYDPAPLLALATRTEREEIRAVLSAMAERAQPTRGTRTRATGRR